MNWSNPRVIKHAFTEIKNHKRYLKKYLDVNEENVLNLCVLFFTALDKRVPAIEAFSGVHCSCSSD